MTDMQSEKTLAVAQAQARTATIIASVLTLGLIIAMVVAAAALSGITTLNNRLETATFAQGQALALLATATNAQGQAIAAQNTALARIDLANATISPLSVQQATLSAQQATLAAQQASLQDSAAEALFDANRMATLFPVLGQVPPTAAPTLSYPQKLATATNIAAAYQITATATSDSKNIAMVTVPSGCFYMGDATVNDAKPVAEICFSKPYLIDQNEVTNAAYGEFVKAGGYTAQGGWTEAGWKFVQDQKTAGKALPADHGDAFNKADQPRIGVTWYEANAYCKWRGGRLPTESEWEYAARGPGSRAYPWGNAFVDANAVFNDNMVTEPAKVGSKPAGRSWIGANDLAGNVQEWVNTAYSEYDTGFNKLVKTFAYPYTAGDGRESMTGNLIRVVRGGSLIDYAPILRGAYRRSEYPMNEDFNLGFRCVRTP